jgi:hypothetical protein
VLETKEWRRGWDSTRCRLPSKIHRRPLVSALESVCYGHERFRPRFTRVPKCPHPQYFLSPNAVFLSWISAVDRLAKISLGCPLHYSFLARRARELSRETVPNLVLCITGAPWTAFGVDIPSSAPVDIPSCVTTM